MTEQKKEYFKTEVIFTRVRERSLKTFDRLIEARGLRRSEAMRQIIEAWMRQPDKLPVGSPPQIK